MSRQNKVNKGNYVQKGRLTPDMARERQKQRKPEEVNGAARTIGREKREPESTRGRSAPEE
jgi:hypothetical protein